MLENMPRVLGDALSGVRAGIEKTLYHAAFADVPATIRVASPAFETEGLIPACHTADGDGRSPPITWQGVPQGTAAVALVIEDPDAPTPQPLVHLIAYNLPGEDRTVASGAFAGPAGRGEPYDLGQNSFLKAAYLPPDPPTGHGAHRYLVQIYALDRALDLPASPGRAALVAAMQGRVLGKGLLTGIYERP